MKSYKLLLILLCIPMLSFGNNDKKKHEKSKTINKEYDVNSDAKVALTNKYGNLNITTWDKNRVEIEVKITVKGNDLDDVENQLENIDVNFSASTDLVTAKTILTRKKSSWSWFGGSNNIHYEINYTVKMPASNSVDLNNDYGNIYLDKLNGQASINCDYGKIEIDELTADNNDINLDYCSQSHIGFIKSGNVDSDYSKLTVNKSEKLRVNQDYSSITIKTIKKVNFNSDYGHMTIDKSDEITGDSDYAGMRFGTVRKSLKIDSDYSSLKVAKLSKDFDFVKITSEYAGIKIGFESGIVFNFTIDLQYAGFKRNDEKIEFFKSISKPTKKYYEGKYGTGKTNSKITIDSEYGSLTFKEN